LDIPVLWLYGALDKSQPVDKDVAALNQLRRRGKDFSVRVFPHANHALLVSETGNCWQPSGPGLVPGLAVVVRAWLRGHRLA
jgi:dienelactone hydrolase